GARARPDGRSRRRPRLGESLLRTGERTNALTNPGVAVDEGVPAVDRRRLRRIPLLDVELEAGDVAPREPVREIDVVHDDGELERREALRERLQHSRRRRPRRMHVDDDPRRLVDYQPLVPNAPRAPVLEAPVVAKVAHHSDLAAPLGAQLR